MVDGLPWRTRTVAAVSTDDQGVPLAGGQGGDPLFLGIDQTQVLQGDATENGPRWLNVAFITSGPRRY